MIEFTVPGEVRGKGRPKFSRHGERVVARTDAATVRAENRVLAAWHAAGRPRAADGPLALSVELVVARPKGHFRSDGVTLSAAGQRAVLPQRKPDVDNALKLVMDALNGAAYRDDVDVVQVMVTRRWAEYSEDERMDIHIREATRLGVLDRLRAWLHALSAPQ